MLILSRQTDQVIQIGPNVEVMVVSIRGNKVRLGITAPDDWPIRRGEKIEVELEGETLVENTDESSGV